MVGMTSHSSSYGRALFHLSFIVKYRHKIFSYSAVRKRCEQLLVEAAVEHKIQIIEIGFDVDHVHMVVEIGLKSVPEVVKLLKGYSAKVLLQEFPELKQQFFYGSGLWSPAYFFDSIGSDYFGVCDYVRNQEYS
jgi:putative transposase